MPGFEAVLIFEVGALRATREGSARHREQNETERNRNSSIQDVHQSLTLVASRLSLRRFGTVTSEWPIKSSLRMRFLLMK